MNMTPSLVDCVSLWLKENPIEGISVWQSGIIWDTNKDVPVVRIGKDYVGWVNESVDINSKDRWIYTKAADPEFFDKLRVHLTTF